MTMQAPIARLSPREAASAAVALWVPECDPKERELRARLHVARDAANTRSARAQSFDAGRLYAIASSIAGEWVFRRPADGEQLSDVLGVLARIFVSAGVLERLEAERDG
jgi:hypothetical protein